MQNRLPIAILTFAAIVGLADLHGWGHGYVGLLALVFWCAVIAVSTIRNQNRIIAAMLVISAMMMPLCVTQMFFVPRAVGVFESANYLGGYAALNIFIAVILAERLNWRDNHFLWLVGGGNILMLLLSQSRGAILAATLGGVSLPTILTPRLRSGLLFATAALVVLITATRGWGLTDDPRLSLWRIAIHVGLDRPWLGWGQGGVALGWNAATNFYSIPIQWFVYTGIAGILAGGWMLAEAVQRGRYEHLAFFIAWFVNGLFMCSRPETDIALFAVLGLLASERRDVANGAVVVHNRQPLLNGRMRAGGAD